MTSACRVYVTGASGFVGKSLCQSLVQGGYSVISAVRRTPDHALAGEVVNIDLLDCASVTQSMQRVDCVIHLAGRAHVLNDQATDPMAAFRVANVETTLMVARAALAAGVKRFVFVSSIGVNGSETGGQAFTEQSAPAPVADYAVSKLEAERALQELLEGSTLELVIVRPPLIYGAHAPGNFARLLRLVQKGLPLPFGSLCNRRSIISLGNLVDFLTLTVHHPKAAGELFLIADGSSVSTRQIVQYLAHGMGRSVRCFPMPSVVARAALTLLGRRGIFVQLFGSLEVSTHKATTLLGWQPVESTPHGLVAVGKAFTQRTAVGA